MPKGLKKFQRLLVVFAAFVNGQKRLRALFAAYC